MDDNALRALLERSRTIAVVGLSDKPERDSNVVARYLLSAGYEVVPVNPMLPSVLGQRSYPSLSAIPPGIRIDIVDIFRKSSEVGPIAAEALARGVGAVWMQLGVENAEAAGTLGRGGIPVVQNLCIRQEHERLKVAARPRVAAGGG